MCRQITSRSQKMIALLVLVVAGAGVELGCQPESSTPSNATPIVSPDSPQAKQAQAETDRMLLERQKQEAKARNRPRALPEKN